MNCLFASVILFLVAMISCSACGVLPAHSALNEVRMTIQEAEKYTVQEEGLYHLAAAKRLLEAAEKEYEEADFYEARKLALEAKRQGELAIEVSKAYSEENTH